MDVRVCTLVVALALAGCGDPEPRPEPAPGPATAPAPRSSGPGPVEGATLHECVRSIAKREALHIAVDPRLDGPVDDATRDRMARSATWREQLELLVIAFDGVLRQQHGQQYVVTFEERVDVVADLKQHDAWILLGAWAGKTVSVEPQIPDEQVQVHEVGVHWRALLERQVKALGPYVIVEEGEFLEVVPLERRTVQDEGRAPLKLARGIVARVEGNTAVFTAPAGGPETTYLLPKPTTPHLERVRDFLHEAAGRRRWAVVNLDTNGTIQDLVVRTSARGR